MREFDVIIVGAGLSGMAAGLSLQEENKKNFLILEAREITGGRVFTFTTEKGNKVDKGVIQISIIF